MVQLLVAACQQQDCTPNAANLHLCRLTLVLCHKHAVQHGIQLSDGMHNLCMFDTTAHVKVLLGQRNTEHDSVF